MPGENIVDLEGLLKQYIGPDKDIVDIKRERLTAPGENYCSIMLKLDITLKNLKTGMEESLPAVAKTINVEVSEFFRKAAPMQFKKEIAFYTQIVPALQAFQKEQGVTESLDLFPKLYAARANLHGKDDEVDDDSVIILENLKEQGYSNIDRDIGFDLDGAKLVLKDLAIFHAIIIAYKIKHPADFESKFQSHCYQLVFPDLPKPDEPIPESEWLVHIRNHEDSKPYAEMVSEINDASNDTDSASFMFRPCVEPFATFYHSDMWCNNSMQKNENGKLIKNKLIDFQTFLYASPTCDLIFFLWSSIQSDVVKNHFEELVKHYHRNFCQLLENFGCDISPFGYDRFREQIDAEAHYEFMHLIYMASVIHGKKGEYAFDMADDDIMKSFNQLPMTKTAVEKIVMIVVEFGKRGWLKSVKKQ